MENNSSSNLDKYTSYSRTRQDNNSSGKKKISPTLIVVILVFILLSIGGVYVLATRNSDKTGDTEKTTETQQTEEAVQEEIEPEIEEQEEDTEETIDVSEKESDSSAENMPSEGDFSQENQEVGSSKVEDVSIESLEHKAYDGFLRIIFEVDSEDSPLVTGSISSSSNLIALKFKGIVEDNSGISVGNGLDVKGSVVSTIFHEVTSEENTTRYLIGVKQTTGFYLHLLSDPTRIVLDVQEQEVENGNGEEFSFSQDAQSFEGNASGNVITVSGLSYSNQGDVYRIIFRLGSTGTGSIPAASSEIVDYQGGKAIKLVVENMYSDWVAEGNYDEDYPDSAVTGMEGSYSSNTSTYYVQINGSRNYKLYYRTAPAQLIVDVKR